MNTMIDMLIVIMMIGFIGTAIGLTMKIVGFFYNMIQRRRG
jgi:hypothetical protein